MSRTDEDDGRVAISQDILKIEISGPDVSPSTQRYGSAKRFPLIARSSHSH
jgi:hypothetical protein